MKMLRTTVPGLVKDPRTGMFINTNMGQLALAKAARKKAREDRALREDLERLKTLLEAKLNVG